MNDTDLDARYEAVLRYLDDRTDYERALAMPYDRWAEKLQRMRDLLARLGNPQQRLPIVHVAGTKGKGSTAAMIAAVLSAAGYRTGLFTSPHLNRVEERIALDGQPCSRAELVGLVDRLRPAVHEIDRQQPPLPPGEQLDKSPLPPGEQLDKSPLPPGEGKGEGDGPTFFEITTAMALAHFAARGADFAVLEVGLGGRLDSTNVCQPRIAVITSISFDHVRQLGNTLEAIAREKAGIIKPGVPVVSGVTEAGPREVIREICNRNSSPLVELGIDFDFRYEPPRHLERSEGLSRVDFQYRVQGSGFRVRDSEYSEPGGAPAGSGPVEFPAARRSYTSLPLSLLGRHQAANAAVALATLCRLQDLGWVVPQQAIRQGLGGLKWPARVELVARHPAIVIDAAHNVASVEALLRVLDESFSPRRRFLFFATTREKDTPGMLNLLLPRFDYTILTRYLNNPRAVPVEELVAAARTTGKGFAANPDPIEAWKMLRAMAAPEDLICVTGSFYIAAQIREMLKDK